MGVRNKKYGPDTSIADDPEITLSANDTTEDTPTEKNSRLKQLGKAIADGYGDTEFANMSIGDIIGIASTYKGARAGLENTLENRAGDTPNVNYFKNFGDEALKTIDESKGEAKKVLDINKKDINRSRRGLVIRNRNSARSVNTMRSLDIAAEAQANIANTSALEAYSSVMQTILDKKANAQLAIDNVKMKAEGDRDIADRQDRDNFYTQKGKDLASMYEGYQKIGRHLNDIKEREMLYTLLEQQGGGLVEYDRKSGQVISARKKKLEAKNKTKKG